MKIPSYKHLMNKKVVENEKTENTENTYSSNKINITLMLAVIIGLIFQKWLLYLCQDFQMDFFGFYESFRVFAAGASPYFNSLDNYSGATSEYPPTIFVVLSWLHLLSYSAAKSVWMLLTITSIIAQIWLVRKYIGDYASIIFAGLMLSFPAEFVLQRGQIDLLIAFCTTYFIIHYLRNDKKWLPTTLLAFVISIKIVPALFGLIYLHRKDYKGLLRLTLMTMIISALTWGIASMVYPDIVHDFIKALLSSENARNNSGMPTIQQYIVDNWVSFDGWKWRASMNYFGSYYTISLVKFVNFALSSMFDYQMNPIIFTSIASLGVWLISIKSTTKTFIVRLSMVYCILNPASWGTNIVIMFVGLTYVIEDIRMILIQKSCKFGVTTSMVLVLFSLSVFIVLSPRYIPWEYHAQWQFLICLCVCLLAACAGYFEKIRVANEN